MYLEGTVKDVDTIRYATKEGMEARGVEVYPNTELLSFDAERHVARFKDLVSGKEREESYDKLILSPGSVPFIPDVPGKDLENVVGFGGRQSAEDLRYKCVTPAIKNVVVIGGGYIGIEAAVAFAKNGKHVTVIDLLDRPLDIYLDKELSDILEADMKLHGIDFVGGQRVTEYIGCGCPCSKQKVRAVKTDKGEYPADLVIVSAGVRPNTGFLKGLLDLHENGMIKTNDYMETSAKDVYAVGNATLIRYNPTDSHINIALATNARKQGRYAAKNALGEKIAFEGVQGTSGLRVFDYKIASTGLNQKSAGRSGVPYAAVMISEDNKIDYHPACCKEKVYAKLYYNPETRRVLGGQILSKADMTEMMNTLSMVIQAKMTVDQLAYADFFFQPTFNRPWGLLNELGLAAQRALKK